MTDPSDASSPVMATIARWLADAGGRFFGLLGFDIVMPILASNFPDGPQSCQHRPPGHGSSGPSPAGPTASITTCGIGRSGGAVLALRSMVLGGLSHDGGWPLWAAMIASLLVGAAAVVQNGLGMPVEQLQPAGLTTKDNVAPISR